MDPSTRNRPFAHVSLAQSPGVYLLTLTVGDNCEISFTGPLDDFEALAREIGFKVQNQRRHDVERSFGAKEAG